MLLSHVAGNALTSADFLAVLQLIFSVRTNWRVTKFVFKYTLLSWVSLQEKQFIIRISLQGKKPFCRRSTPEPDTAAQYFSPSLGDEIKIIWLSNYITSIYVLCRTMFQRSKIFNGISHPFQGWFHARTNISEVSASRRATDLDMCLLLCTLCAQPVVLNARLLWCPFFLTPGTEANNTR